MRLWALIKLYFFCAFFLHSFNIAAQAPAPDAAAESPALQRALEVYHQSLSPETGLYNGAEYTYSIYYPFIIDQGDPFFQSKRFDTGSLVYNNILYKKVPLLYDIVKGELLINDPGNTYIIRLHNERIDWFNLWGQTFVQVKKDSSNGTIQTGFYNILYNGNTSLYKRPSKLLKESYVNSMGLHKYVVEIDAYFVKKGNLFYEVKNKKALLALMGDRKKEVEQFIKKNRLSYRKDQENALVKIVAYYDGLNNRNITMLN
jgi:hypothetical protein